MKKTSSDTRASDNDAQFDWNTFIEKVKELNDAIYSQLKRTQHEYSSGTLHIYPELKTVRTILSRDNNKAVLIEAGGGVKITIHEVGDTPEGAQKDDTLARISDIMGGEVKNDGGGNPF